MTIAFVTSVNGSASLGSSATTGALSTNAGDLVVVSTSIYSSVGATDYFTSVTDSKTNTNTLRSGPVGVSNHRGDTRLHECFPGTVGAGHTWTLTITVNDYPVIAAAQFTGLSSSGFDQQNTGIGTSGTSHVSGQITTTQNDELIVGALGITTGNAGTFSAPMNGDQLINDGAIEGLMTGYQIVSTIQTNYSFTASTAASGLNPMCIASWKMASGGATLFDILPSGLNSMGGSGSGSKANTPSGLSYMG